MPPKDQPSGRLLRGLFLCHVLYVLLHPGGAVLLRLLRDMPVHVQGKGGGGVSKIVLHGLDRVAVLEGEHGEGVAEIVNAAFRHSDCSRQGLL